MKAVSGVLDPWPGPAVDHLVAAAGLAPATFRPLAGDLSARRYARVEGRAGATAIVALYPLALRPALGRFLAATALCAEAGVRVPRLLGHDEEAGLVLQEDFGRETLFARGAAPWEELAPLYLEAIAAAQRIAGLSCRAVAALGSPPLDAALLARELEPVFALVLGPRRLVPGAAESELRGVLTETCARLGEGPLVACHRDFMVRNLMPLTGAEAGRLGVIDHQDLRLGPPWYDLASLLNDSLFPPPELAAQWLERAGVRPGPSVDYHRAAAQRGLKAAGTFASFAARGADRHLPLVAQTLLRALWHLGQTPEGRSCAGRLAPVWRAGLAPGLC